MSLQKTQFVILSAPLPADFHGDAAVFQRAIVERLTIHSPQGVATFVDSDVEPTSNVGPWFKGGTQLWVFDDTQGKYVPLDISESLKLVTISAADPGEPEEGQAQIWIRTTGTRVIGIYFWNGEEWRPGGNVPASGPTADRPANPQDLEEFFDSDISCLIHWERGAWRTVAGSIGDVKFVTHATLADAITASPGWAYLGEANASFRGRALAVASKDPGLSPDAAFATNAGISARAALDVFGEETHILEDDEIPQHTHLVGALSALHSDNNGRFFRVDDADNIPVPEPQPPNWAAVQGDGTSDGTQNGQLPAAADGTQLVTSKQLSETEAAAFTEPAAPHENWSPSVALWALVKQ